MKSQLFEILFCISGKKKKKSLKRADPRSLRQEDSESVWNELTFFKTKAKNLSVEK